MRYYQLTQPLYEGVRFGKKEFNATLENIDNYKMGIEYEVLPSDDTIDENEFLKVYKIPKIGKIEEEHDNMVEFITAKMDVVKGLNHIKHFMESAYKEGFEFPEMAGLHVSISMKNTSFNANIIKFLVLMSGNYLDSYFPEREHTENIENIIGEILENNFNNNSKFNVDEIENTLKQSEDLQSKYLSIKTGDYLIHNGRIELRFFGGENYNEKFENIRWQIIRAIFLLGISYDENLYKQEYQKMLYKLFSEYALKSDEEKLIMQLKNYGSRKEPIGMTIKQVRNTLKDFPDYEFKSLIPHLKQLPSNIIFSILLYLNLEDIPNNILFKAINILLDKEQLNDDDPLSTAYYIKELISKAKNYGNESLISLLYSKASELIKLKGVSETKFNDETIQEINKSYDLYTTVEESGSLITFLKIFQQTKDERYFNLFLENFSENFNEIDDHILEISMKAIMTLVSTNNQTVIDTMKNIITDNNTDDDIKKYLIKELSIKTEVFLNVFNDIVDDILKILNGNEKLDFLSSYFTFNLYKSNDKGEFLSHNVEKIEYLIDNNEELPFILKNALMDQRSKNYITPKIENYLDNNED